MLQYLLDDILNILIVKIYTIIKNFRKYVTWIYIEFNNNNEWSDPEEYQDTYTKTPEPLIESINMLTYWVIISALPEDRPMV